MPDAVRVGLRVARRLVRGRARADDGDRGTGGEPAGADGGRAGAPRGTAAPAGPPRRRDDAARADVGVAVSLAVRAAIALDLGDLAEAARLAERALRQLPAHNRAERAPILEVLARAQSQAGDVPAARVALGELQEASRLAGTQPLAAAVSATEGAVAAAAGDFDAARRHREDAVDRFEHLGMPFEEGRARIDLAITVATIGDKRAAAAEARRAVARFESIAATRDLARARDLVTELAGPSAAADPALAPKAAGLTGRELEIVRLIAAGHNNAAIGRRLFISAHTVHRHVANIFTKLDVPTRSRPWPGRRRWACCASRARCPIGPQRPALAGWPVPAKPTPLEFRYPLRLEARHEAVVHSRRHRPQSGHRHCGHVRPDAAAWPAESRRCEVGPAPPVLPAGAQAVVLFGDPFKPGPFALRLKFPANYNIPAHSHPTDENVTVTSGVFIVGMGDKLDRNTGQSVSAGGFGSLPANMNHYAYTKVETTVVLFAQGPFEFK